MVVLPEIKSESEMAGYVTQTLFDSKLSTYYCKGRLGESLRSTFAVLISVFQSMIDATECENDCAKGVDFWFQ